MQSFKSNLKQLFIISQKMPLVQRGVLENNIPTAESMPTKYIAPSDMSQAELVQSHIIGGTPNSNALGNGDLKNNSSRNNGLVEETGMDHGSEPRGK